MFRENVDYLHFIDAGIGIINIVARCIVSYQLYLGPASQVTTGNEFDWLTLITP